MDKSVIAIESTWYRCVSRKREPLSTAGSLLNAGRYNTVGLAVLYLSSSPHLAVSEKLHLGEMYGVARFPPRLLVSVDVMLSSVLDLTDPAVLKRLSVSPEQLLAPYSEDRKSPSITQVIASIARSRGVEAMKAPSALVPSETNLVVFPENVAAADAIKVIGFDDQVDC